MEVVVGLEDCEEVNVESCCCGVESVAASLLASTDWSAEG